MLPFIDLFWDKNLGKKLGSVNKSNILDKAEALIKKQEFLAKEKSLKQLTTKQENRKTGRKKPQEGPAFLGLQNQRKLSGIA